MPVVLVIIEVVLAHELIVLRDPDPMVERLTVIKCHEIVVDANKRTCSDVRTW